MVHICGEDGEGYDCQESYVGECTGSHSVGRPQKRWLDTVKECWKKKRFGCQASKENGPG